MEYFWYVLIAVIIAILISQTRTAHIEDGGIIKGYVGWVMVIYGLILGFSLTNFYSRYVAMRNAFIKDATNYQLIYEFFIKMDKSPEIDDIINSILKYLELISSIGIDYKEKLKISDNIYKDMNTKIINYLKNNQTSFTNNILSRLNTNIEIKKLADEIEAGQYYIAILCFLVIFIIIPLAISTSMLDRKIQFLLDFSILIIISTALYLCEILNNPFIQSPISFNLSMYSDLIDTIKKDIT